MTNRIILDLCGGTGSWSKPYKEAGYDVHVITLPEYDILQTVFHEDRLTFYKPEEAPFGRILLYEDIYGILAAPPCTMFSIARTTAKKPRDLREGMKVVEMCMQIIWRVRAHHKLAFWAMENPRGILRQFLGRPAYTFDPTEFNDDYNKWTDLWGYFNAPEKKYHYLRYEFSDTNNRKLPEIPTDYKRDPNMKPLAIRRSMTSGRFAQAFFRANP